MTTIVDQAQLATQLRIILEPYTAQKHLDPNLDWLLPCLKQTIIDTTLVHTRGNQQHTGRILGMNRGTIRKYCSQRR